MHSTFVRRSPERSPGRESESVAEGGSQEQSPVSGVAERYATALFELASEAKSVDAVAKDLDAFSAMIAESDDLRRLIGSPAFSTQDQVSAVTALTAKAGISGVAANFIGFVASKRRLFALPGMIRAFRAKVAEAKGVVSAEVTLAEQPSAAQLKDIAATLKDVAGKDVDVSVKVDPAIIGGLVVKMGSRMVDASLKTKLNSIRLAMKEVG
jgi:F-type H+-transporting ATPase subunit delta